MSLLILKNSDVNVLAETTALSVAKMAAKLFPASHEVKVFPIPRGGVPAAYAVRRHTAFEIVDSPEEADFFIDDLLDSGATLEKWSDEYPGKLFFTLIDKQHLPTYKGRWIVFPWERGPEEDTGVEDNIRRVLEFIGEDPTREGLLETPKRVAKALRYWYSGYSQDPKEIMKVFEDGAEGCDEMVVVENIPFFSNCEHHMAPIIGTATIGYIPNGKIIGLSKIPRLLEVFSRRLQVQERLTNQVANALMEHLSPLGCGVMIKARHLCMESRGVEKIGSETVTSALRGVFKDQLSTRNEFMAIARK